MSRSPSASPWRLCGVIWCSMRHHHRLHRAEREAEQHRAHAPMLSAVGSGRCRTGDADRDQGRAERSRLRLAREAIAGMHDRIARRPRSQAPRIEPITEALRCRRSCPSTGSTKACTSAARGLQPVHEQQAAGTSVRAAGPSARGLRGPGDGGVRGGSPAPRAISQAGTGGSAMAPRRRARKASMSAARAARVVDQQAGQKRPDEVRRRGRDREPAEHLLELGRRCWPSGHAWRCNAITVAPVAPPVSSAADAQAAERPGTPRPAPRPSERRDHDSSSGRPKPVAVGDSARPAARGRPGQREQRDQHALTAAALWPCCSASSGVASRMPAIGGVQADLRADDAQQFAALHGLLPLSDRPRCSAPAAQSCARQQRLRLAPRAAPRPCAARGASARRACRPCRACRRPCCPPVPYCARPIRHSARTRS